MKNSVGRYVGAAPSPTRLWPYHKGWGRYLKLAYRPVGHDVVEVVREGAGATCGSDREIAVYIERHAAGGLTRQVIDGGHIQSKHVHNLYTGGKPRGAGVGLVTA